MSLPQIMFERKLAQITITPSSFSGVIKSHAELLEVPEDELVRQFSLIENRIFAMVQPYELRGLAWTKPDRNETSPNIAAQFNHFNRKSSL
jgi:hypothetical protein